MQYRGMKTSSQSGQIALLVMLLMVVVLTVALSLASRQTSDVQLSGQQQDSSVVYYAAEAGVEDALQSLADGTKSFALGDRAVSVNTTVTTEGNGTGVEFETDRSIVPGESMQIDLGGSLSGGSGSIQVSWADSSPDVAILITVFNENAGVATQRVYGLNSQNHGSDDFPSSGNGVYGDINIIPLSGTYEKMAFIYLWQKDVRIHIAPLTGTTKFLVNSGDVNIPAQQYRIESLASNDNGTEKKKIEATRTVNQVPTIFDYVLYSGTTIQ